MMVAQKEYLIIDKKTGEQLAKDEFKVPGSRVNKNSANIRLSYANNAAGYEKYKIVRGESLK